MTGGEDPEETEGFPQRDSFQYTLGNLLKLPGDTFMFIYDLGDDWKHIVKLTDILPNSLAGPEDEERESYLKWLGRNFNPDFFDLHEIQYRVDDCQRVIGEARWEFYHR